MSKRVLAVLGYHKIGAPPPGGWPSWFYVPEQTFAEHLRYLRSAGWTVLGKDQFAAGLSDPKSLPERSAVLTFDDGYRSMREVALPLLASAGMPAVLFVPTNSIGQRNDFDCGVEPDEPICDWDDLCELQRRGVSIQSHGASHSRLSELPASVRAEELRASKTLLEARLGRTVDLFAFPYGDDGGEHRAEVRLALLDAGYSAAFTYCGGTIALPVVDRYRVERLAIGPDTDLAEVLR